MTGKGHTSPPLRWAIILFLAATAGILANAGSAEGAGNLTHRLSGTYPGSALIPETMVNCLRRTVIDGQGTADIRQMCYRGSQVEPDPLAMGPPPFIPANHGVLTGSVQGGALTAQVVECQAFLGLLAVDVTESTPGFAKAGGPFTTTVTVVQDTTSPFDCADGDVTTGPLTLTPLADTHNEDGAEYQSVLGIPEYCADYEELGDDPLKGGLRDPFNPYDFYDTNGNGTVDLTGDVLGVITHWTPAGAPYDPVYDRGPGLGPYAWNTSAPDGSISLTYDILPVVNQWQHSCQAAPLSFP